MNRSSIPTRPPTTDAALRVSPVSICTSTPSSISPFTTLAASSLTASAAQKTATMPNPSAPTYPTVPPSALQRVILSTTDASRRAYISIRSKSLRFPAKIFLPFKMALTPSPFRIVWFCTSPMELSVMPSFLVACKSALARGCTEEPSRAATIWSISERLGLFPIVSRCNNLNLPSVSVPVLSRATLETLPSASRCAPPLTITPRRANAANPAM
mmetsp:Transcript_45526/g.88937  ORF Transcript_45526/g.88937 Transcript_45526/m.88937 type:complete len:214 (+) Transcript_45526:643-1284(+)